MNISLGLINLLELLAELRETLYLLGHLFIFIYKGTELSKGQMEEIPKGKYEKRGWGFPAFSVHTSLLESPCVYQPESSSDPLLLGFYGDFIT